MYPKKQFLTWVCAGMLCITGQAQTVHWNASDGSVTVSGEQTFTTYIATTDETVRSLMTHLNFYRIYYLGGYGPSGINASQFGAGGRVTFKIFAYNAATRTKGYLLYGCYSDLAGTHEKTWDDIYKTKHFTSHCPSNLINILAQDLKIFTPPGCHPAAEDSLAHYWSLSRELHPLKQVYQVLSSGKNLQLVQDSTLSLLQNAGWPRDVYVQNASADCMPYYTPIQPVIVELTVKNATVHKMIIPEINTSNHIITPYDLFHVWHNTDYSDLFRTDRTTIVAHRGYWRNAGVPQNSIAAIQAAADRQDVDIIELDVRSSQDKKAICFHDDKPQKVLRDLPANYATSSLYDLPLATLQQYNRLYDRFDLGTDENLLTLEEAFQYLHDHQVTKPLNLDIGIPDNVPTAGGGESGKPFYDAVFLQAVGAACRYGLTGQIIFKGKYPYNDPIWNAVRDTLHKYTLATAGGSNVTAHPVIAYTPKLGDDIPEAERQAYRDNWLDIGKGRGIPFVAVVGMEVRLKKDDNSNLYTFLKESISKVKSLKYQGEIPLRVGIFSETPTSCSGYWTKSAVEKYVDFNEDNRNNFDWVLNHGYDYVITDIPEVLYANQENYKDINPPRQ